MRTVLRSAAAIAALALCAASATGYGAKGPLGNGYSETALGPGMWSINVQVNGYTSRGTALEYAYRRAGELCPRGYDLMDRDANTRYSTYNGNLIEKPEVTLVVRCR